jgi:hypothetical protein
MKKYLVLLTLLFLMVTSMACSCSFIGFDRLYNSLPDVVVEAGSGNVVSKEIEVSNAVKEVEVNSIGMLHLSQGEEASLVIEAEDNYIDRIETKIENDRLTIQIKNEWFNSWVPTEPIHYYLTLPEITEIQLDGALRLVAEPLIVENLLMEFNGTVDIQLSDLTASNLTFNIAGAANVNTALLEANTVTVDIDGVSNANISDLQADTLTIDISGGGNLNVAGNVARQDVQIDGGGSYQAGDLRSDDAVINNSGAANVTVWVEKSLDLACDGAARIAYYGTPKVHQNNSGFAVIESLGEKEE